MFKSNRNRGAVGLIATILVVSAGAFAYWLAGGAGSGTASAGGTSALTVNQTTVLDAMYPGDRAQTISGNFDNPNSGPIRVNTVTVSIDSVVKASDAPAGTCDATDFTLADTTMTVNAEVAAGSGKGSWTGATIKFNNKATNQDACKGATVNLSYEIA